VITIGALDAVFGAADYNVEEAQVARAMVANAHNVIVLADSSKFARSAPFVVCRLDRIHTLVSDSPPSPALAHALARAGVQVL
jgi:DeoR family glycerol-3-phosphate regulon repressor